MFWLTVMQKATYKLQIHTREWSLSYGEPPTIPEYLEETRHTILDPDSTFRHFAATQHPLS